MLELAQFIAQGGAWTSTGDTWIPGEAGVGQWEWQVLKPLHLIHQSLKLLLYPPLKLAVQFQLMLVNPVNLIWWCNIALAFYLYVIELHFKILHFSLLAGFFQLWVIVLYYETSTKSKCHSTEPLYSAYMRSSLDLFNARIIGKTMKLFH